MERRSRLRWRVWWIAAAGLAVMAGVCGLPDAARAQEPSTYARLYYSTWMTGRVPYSPADPNGVYHGGEPLGQNRKTGLEVIFLQRLGLSYGRQTLHRTFAGAPAHVPGCLAAGCVVLEEAQEQSFNATLYGREVRHDSFNLFFGGGSGTLSYTYAVDGIKQDGGEVFRSMPLSQWFWGFEYSFERMGFRVDFSRMEASKSLPGQRAQLAENRSQVSFFIPLN